jgi:hypothetical protein
LQHRPSFFISAHIRVPHIDIYGLNMYTIAVHICKGGENGYPDNLHACQSAFGFAAE